ncbi:MAG: alpha/beta hydrolase [Bacteroidales bacterium]|jgi:acetyl esterase/lipase|nr:alpha/beta hydrolase [Bacteroidales bacterium]
MKKIVYLVCFMAVCKMSVAQNFTETVLWPDGTTENNGIVENELTENNFFVRNISTAKLYVYRPENKNNTGAAVIICPGGGYAGEAIFHEGHDFAKWLTTKGITGVVLKYRLPNGFHFIPLKDAQRAIRTVRYNAKKWNIDPGKIGISGFSAGGHLASTAGTHFDKGNSKSRDEIERLSCRPDFMILFYPVITMRDGFTHEGSRKNLLGEDYKPELEKLYSNEEQVTEMTPPTFLILSDDDTGVLPRNSVEFYMALKQFQIPASLHIIPSGGHGWGTNPSNAQYQAWSVSLESWLGHTVLK